MTTALVTTSCGHGPARWWFQGWPTYDGWCSIACVLDDLGVTPSVVTVTMPGDEVADVRVDEPDGAIDPVSLTVIAPGGEPSWSESRTRNDVARHLVATAAVHGHWRDLDEAGVLVARR